MVEGKLRPTNAAEDSKGQFLGLEGSLAYWPAGFGFAGVLLFTALTRSVHLGFLPSAIVSFAPAVGVLIVCYTLINKKPPGHLQDWIDTNLLGKNSASFSSTRQPTVPSRLRDNSQSKTQ